LSLKPRLLWLATATWLALVVFGAGMLVRYASTPGAQSDPPPTWPSASRLERPDGRYLLLLAVHPRCPCTRATLGELEVIMSHSSGRIVSRVLFVQPAGAGDSWARSGLWRQAASIPGVEPVLDPRGREALRFGALTSGHTVVYAPDGRLLFHGGITGARGHFGSNTGADAVLATVEGERTPVGATPVFGCPLSGPPPGRPSRTPPPCPSH
jgi:hypothetical protein